MNTAPTLAVIATVAVGLLLGIAKEPSADSKMGSAPARQGGGPETRTICHIRGGTLA